MRVKQICKVTHIPRSSCYYKIKHKDGKKLKDKGILDLIKNIFEQKHQKAGIRTISMILRNKYNMIINLKRIARIKKQYGLITKIRKKNPYNIMFKKGLEHRTAPNLLR